VQKTVNSSDLSRNCLTCSAAGIEALGLIGDQLKMQGAFWDAIGSLNNNSSKIGLIVIGVFVVSWAASMIIYFLHRFDEIEVKSLSSHRG
jgi:high-affinity nickel-transport protein